MKLLIHLKSLSTRGGAERAVVGLAGELVRRGHEVAISVCDPRGSEPAYPIPDGVRMVWLAPERIRWYQRPLDAAKMLYQQALKRHVRDNDYDIILGWLRYGAAQVGWLPRSVRARRMGAMRNLPYGIGRPPPGKLKTFVKFYHRRAGYARTDRIFVQMPQFFDMMPPEWQAKACVIPNAVEIPDTTGPAYDSRARLIVAVARLVDVKRHDHLIRGFARFHKAHPDWKLEIWGAEGRHPRRDMLQGLIDRHGLGDSAALMGLTQDIEAVYNRARILAHPSAREGMSNSVTEAMALGLPVMASADCAGMETLIRDGESGVMIRGEDGGQPLDVQISDALTALAADPARAQRLGQAGRQRMIDRFAPQVVYDLWERELSRGLAD